MISPTSSNKFEVEVSLKESLSCYGWWSCHGLASCDDKLQVVCDELLCTLMNLTARFVLCDDKLDCCQPCQACKRALDFVLTSCSTFRMMTSWAVLVWPRLSVVACRTWSQSSRKLFVSTLTVSSSMTMLTCVGLVCLFFPALRCCLLLFVYFAMVNCTAWLVLWLFFVQLWSGRLYVVLYFFRWRH